MRRITVVLVCAMIAPLAFAQTKSTKTEQTTTTYTAGVVTKYEPGKTILVNSNIQGPVSFALGASARIVNTAGNAVTSALTPGQHVRVYYTGTGVNRVVERVVVEK